MCVGPMRNSLNLLCQCQTAYSAISSCFELLETVRCLTDAWLASFSIEFRLCLRPLDHQSVEWTDRVTAFNGGSALLWGGISLTGNTRLVITAGDLSSQRYLDEILQRLGCLGLYALQSGVHQRLPLLGEWRGWKGHLRGNKQALVMV